MTWATGGGRDNPPAESENAMGMATSRAMVHFGDPIGPATPAREPVPVAQSAPAAVSWIDPIIDAHEQPLLRFAAGVLGRQQDAQDLVQDVFLKLIDHRRRGEPMPDDIGAWLFTVARNRAMDEIRKRQRRRQHDRVVRDQTHAQREQALRTAPTPLAQLADAEQADQAAKLLGELPEQQREVLAMHVLAGRSLRDVASAVGSSPSTVAYQVKRGLQALAAQLRSQGLIGEATKPDGKR